jgi:CheY-like chemotaxis protein
MLSRIDKGGRTLLKLIDDVLDISKVEAGKINIEKTRFSPAELVSEVVTLLRMQAEQKGLRILVDIEAGVPASACSDTVRLRQILMNLIGNGVKFTQRGEVTVRVSAESDTAGGKEYLSFEIIDTGIGISEKDKQKLFQAFSQADQSITRQFGGTGLGLLLSKRLAENLGGSLTLASSQKGRGSIFIAKIEAGPFEAAPPKTATVSMMPSTSEAGNILTGASILVVEDALDNQILIKRFLEKAGATVELAENGQDAIVKALAGHFDVILMDVQMPVLDGIEATKELRRVGYARPILALTAHAMAEEIHRSKEAGCDQHLTKPVSRQTLIDAVRRYLPRLSA